MKRCVGTKKVPWTGQKGSLDWVSSTPLTLGHQHFRQRISAIDAGPVAAEKVSALPKKQQHEGADENRATSRVGLQGAHRQPRKPERDTGKDREPWPIEQRRTAMFKTDGFIRRRLRQRDTAMQFAHEICIGFVQPLL